MSAVPVSISPAALLIFALALFFDTGGLVSALVPAAAVHEAGHIAALLLSGARIEGIRLEIPGLRLDYRGNLTKSREIFAAASGPTAGVIYSAACLGIEGKFLLSSGVISIFLTLLNLIPALPLDGGRIVLALFGEKIARKSTKIASAALCCLGLAALFAYGAPMPLVFGLWLLLCLERPA